MPADVEHLRRHLQAFDFPGLLVEELGWNRYPARPVSIQVEGCTYTLEPAAEKAGFVVYICGPGPDGGVPPYPVRRKIERQAARVAYEHMVIFVDGQRTTQVWQWVKRKAGKPAACREQEYRRGQRGDALVRCLQSLAFELKEEEGLKIPVVALRVQQALDAERVTKRFYERFKKELETFRSFIQGIAVQGDREWYASLMLNRMMFVYFIQKQGFLDEDPDYLRNRLKRVQEKSGKGKFQQFYRLFLLRLFHEGLGQPEASRAPDLADLLGKVPYLNGGLFDVHDLERDNPDIQIPDEAFEKIFDFFDGYRWHLDERPHRAENEINPDVLGYIFEKYVNQKQMGAYYTKEDITGYIARNTVVPFLFDTARKECPVAFAPEGGIWRLLRDDPDRYIYPAVGHGVTWDARQTPPRPLEHPYELPEEIAAGIDDVSKRGDWNRPAPEEFALPTETWREVVARRQRHQEVRAKLAAGEVHEINDLITLNLDICQFAEDVIVQSEGPELVRAFWHALRDVSVLDPTCGSGAFLFAALNILEPLYTACLERMRGFLDDLQWSQRPHHPEALRDFRTILEQVGKHPNLRYYVLKSIVVNNLYGVDIMEEAVEICKLRLFLKLVAQVKGYDQIEPLPDVDFNIRPGNTLVGFTSLDAVCQAMTVSPDGRYRMLDEEQQKVLDRVNEDAEVAARAFKRFQEQQTTFGGEVTAGHKAELRRRLDSLRAELDRYLAAEFGVEPKDATAYEKWRANHQPFHWFVEFYGIMHRGGFDAIIGNPPYVEYGKVKKEYTIQGYESESCGNLYAFIVERCIELLDTLGRFGMIVQNSLVSTDRMQPIQNILIAHFDNFISNFDDRPAKLFTGLNHMKGSIILTSPRKSNRTYSTKFLRWYDEERNNIFQLLCYTDVTDIRWYMNHVPKAGNSLEKSLINKISAHKSLNAILMKSGKTVYCHRIASYFIKSTNFEPYFFNETEGTKKSEDYKEYYVGSQQEQEILISLFNSGIFLYFWHIFFDGYHCGRANIESFPFSFPVNPDSQRSLVSLTQRLMNSYKENCNRRETNYKNTGIVIYDEFSPSKSKQIIDEVDRVLAKHYDFTGEELDFIINYDIKYRMGQDGGEEDAE